MSLFAQLNAKIPEIHNYAKEKGWWDSPRSTKSIYALFHSEISEAVEEARKPAFDPDLMDMYHIRKDTVFKNDLKEIKETPIAGVIWDGGVCVTKPEGIGVELIDMVIRVLDYMGNEGIEFRDLEYESEVNINWNDLSAFTEIHKNLSLAGAYAEDGMVVEEQEYLGKAIDITSLYFTSFGWNFWEVFDAKHSFNTTRERRHGNKKF
jgi:hypothetical protein